MSIAAPVDGLEWDSLGFSLTRTDVMLISKYHRGTGEWSVPVEEPYGPLILEPAAGGLNYGHIIFEGIKAFRWDDGSVHLFRPDLNAKRARKGAKRLAMPLVEESMFIDAVKKCVVANGKFVPPAGRGALYVRPLLIASGIALSNIPDEYTLCIYCSPVGSYFKSGGREAVGIKVMVSESYNRSVIGGVGAVKMPGNYAPTFLPKKFAAEKGFDEVLFLDGRGVGNIEEAAGSNFFVVVKDVIYTPTVDSETILDGVTRNSICDLATTQLGLTVVSDRPVHSDLLYSASEAFLCGTGASVTPIQSITFESKLDQPIQLQSSSPIASKLHSLLVDIQQGIQPSTWMYSVTPPPVK